MINIFNEVCQEGVTDGRMLLSGSNSPPAITVRKSFTMHDACKDNNVIYIRFRIQFGNLPDHDNKNSPLQNRWNTENETTLILVGKKCSQQPNKKMKMSMHHCRIVWRLNQYDRSVFSC